MNKIKELLTEVQVGAVHGTRSVDGDRFVAASLEEMTEVAIISSLVMLANDSHPENST